ncbi:MAG TPA: lysophospholipid acyltransferase family protein [Kofleriaceae bacterium]|nr:lysophospholipid acyltransferase family protein [Kofleriaceae bacterium]
MREPEDDPLADDEMPDAAVPADADVDDEVFLGEEAVVPEREYGPPIKSAARDLDLSGELRELERRVEARSTPAFPLENRRRVPLQAFWDRYRHFAMRDRSDFVDEFGRDPMYSARMEPVLDFFYRRWFRTDCQGMEHVPEDGRALLVANHSGVLPYDGAILMHAVRVDHPAHRDVRPLVEDFVFHFPWLGTLINRIGGVRACPENATRLLESDQLVAVFPEGVKGIGKLYRERYKLQRFGRGGFIKLALRSKAPIIPVAIVGAEEIHPMLGKVTWLAKSFGVPYVPITPTFPWLGPLGAVPLPSKWTVRFAPPIDVAGEHGPDAAEDRILVNRLSEQVRAQIQEMVNGILAERS